MHIKRLFQLAAVLSAAGLLAACSKVSVSTPGGGGGEGGVPDRVEDVVVEPGMTLADLPYYPGIGTKFPSDVEVAGWVGDEKVDLQKLKGKVVVFESWASW